MGYTLAMTSVLINVVFIPLNRESDHELFVYA